MRWFRSNEKGSICRGFVFQFGQSLGGNVFLVGTDRSNARKKMGRLAMAITFGEIKQYFARNVRLSICFEDGQYHNYLMGADIPEKKYDRFYVYGIGMADVEFSMDVY